MVAAASLAGPGGAGGRDGNICRSKRAECARNANGKTEYERKRKIHQNPGTCHDQCPPSLIAQVGFYIWYGLGPPDDESCARDDEKERKEYGTNEINVLERIEREASGITGGRIALAFGCEAMGDLVHDNRHDEYDDVKNGIDALHKLYSHDSMLIATGNTHLYGKSMRNN